MGPVSHWQKFEAIPLGWKSLKCQYSSGCVGSTSMLAYITRDACLLLTLSLGICFWSLLKTGYWTRWAFSPSQSSSSYVVLSLCALGNIFFVSLYVRWGGPCFRDWFTVWNSSVACPSRHWQRGPWYQHIAEQRLFSSQVQLMLSLESRVAHNCTQQESVRGETGEVLKWALFKWQLEGPALACLSHAVSEKCWVRCREMKGCSPSRWGELPAVCEWSSGSSPFRHIHRLISLLLYKNL